MGINETIHSFRTSILSNSSSGGMYVYVLILLLFIVIPICVCIYSRIQSRTRRRKFYDYIASSPPQPYEKVLEEQKRKDFAMYLQMKKEFDEKDEK